MGNYIYCKYAIIKQIGCAKGIFCTEANSLCGFQRYCVNDKILKHSDNCEIKCKILLEESK